MNILSKESIVYAALFAVGAGGAAYLYDCYEKTEANYWCYSKYDHIKQMGSYQYLDGDNQIQYYKSMKSSLKIISKDNKITNSECSVLNDIIDEAKEIEDAQRKANTLKID